MRKMIALTAIAFAAGILVGWTGLMLAISEPLQGAAAATRQPAAASMMSPLEMMRRSGDLPKQSTSDPF